MSLLRNLTFRINYDINQQQLRQVDREIDSVIASTRDLDRSFQNNAQNAQKLETKQRELQRSLGETSNKVRELKNARRDAIQSHGAESAAVAELNRKIQDATRTQDAYKRELKETERQLQRQTAMQNSIKNLQTMSRETEENVRALRAQGRAFAAEEEQLRGLARQQQEHQRLTMIQRQELNRLTLKYGEHDERVKEAKREYDRLVASQNRTENSLNDLSNRIATTNPRLARMSDNLSSASRRLDHYANRLSMTGSRVKTFGQDISATFGVATLAGGAAIGYSLKKASDFEQGMKNTESLMSTEEWLQNGERLTNMVKKLGAETKYTSVETAQGLQELVKAGVSTADILGGALKDGLNLATAGEVDLAKAAETMSTALNSFTSDTSLTSAKAANLLAGAANASATDVNQLSLALSQSAAVANMVNQSFESTSTAIAVLAQNGLKGSDAGTSLKTMLLNLSPQTKDAASQMEALGLAQTSVTNGYNYLVKRGLKPTEITYDAVLAKLKELAKTQAGEGASAAKVTKEYDKLITQSGLVSSAFFTQSGEAKDMQEIFGILQKSLKGLSEEQRINALKTMFGTDAVRSATIAAKVGSKGFKEMSDAMQGVTAAEVAAKKMDSLKGSITKAKSAANTLVTDFGTALIPVFDWSVKKITTLTNWFNKLDQSTKETIATTGLIATVATAAVAGVGLLALATGGVISGFARILSVGRAVTSWMSIAIARRARSTASLNAETAALLRNAAAQRAAGGAGGPGPVIGSRRNRRSTRGGNPPLPPLPPGAGDLGRNSRRFARLGKGIPILGAALGVGTLAFGGKENIGANLGAIGGSIGGGALAGAAIGTVAGPVGTAIGGTIGAVAGAIGGEKFGEYLQKSIKKHLPKDTLKSTIGDNVSKDTANAIKAYEKLNTSATNELNMLAWSSEKITAENSKSLKDNYSNMASTIKSNMKKRFSETSKVISGALANAKLTKGEKASLIDNLNDYHKKAEKEVDRSERKIKRILEKAKREKRALTKEERQEINKEQEKMREAAVKTLSKSAKEQRTIMSQLKADASGLSAKQAAAVVRNSKKARDGAIKEANKKYKDVIAAADREYYDNKSISKSQYDAIIASAKKTKEDAVSNANEQHLRVVEQAKKQAAGQVDQVNWSTGEMLTKWEKFRNGLRDVINGISTAVNATLKAFGSDLKIPLWPTGSGASAKADVSKSSSNKGVPIGAYASGTSYHHGGPAVVGEEGPELVYTPYGNARLVGTNGAEITNLERGTKVLTASQTRQMMSGGLNGTMPGYAGGTVGASIKEAGQAVWNTTKQAGAYVKDKASDAYDTAKNVATSVYDFAADPSSAIDKIISKYKYKDVLGVGKAAVKKTKDAAVEYIQDKLGAFMGGGDMGVAGGSITNSYGIYDSLFNIAKQIMSSPLGRGLVITSGHRPGDPHDHGKHNAVDLSGFGSNGGYKAVAQWASRLPGVSYTIGDNTVFGRKYGDGSRPNWATGHMNHVHVSGAASNASGGGSASAWSAQIRQAAKQMKVKLSPSELNGIIAQIKRESNGNQSIVQSSAVNDINMRNGNPARGLLQYIPSTFSNYAVKGHTNIMSGYDQLLAFFNNSSWRSDLPYGRSGWGPRGKRRFESGGWKTVDGQVLVGEKGPELVDLPNNSHVNNNTRTNEILNKKRGQEINFSPNITIKIEASESDNIESRVQKAVDAALKQAFKEFGALFDSGVAY